jgi:hypothetical protein
MRRGGGGACPTWTWSAFATGLCVYVTLQWFVIFCAALAVETQEQAAAWSPPLFASSLAASVCVSVLAFRGRGTARPDDEAWQEDVIAGVLLVGDLLWLVVTRMVPWVMLAAVQGTLCVVLSANRAYLHARRLHEMSSVMARRRCETCAADAGVSADADAAA